MPTRAVEPPIWCAMLAQDGDTIIDREIGDKFPIGIFSDDALIVVMGNTPSVSSTPKMNEALLLNRMFPQAKITGLHPMATGEATYPLPSPDKLKARWELIDLKRYRAHNWHCLHDLNSRDNYASLYTSFGCPFDCDFCNIHTLYGGRRVYYRNRQEVIDEIGLLVGYGIKNLKLCDELFTLNHKHIDTICSGIKDYHLNIWAYARVGTVTPSSLKTMKEAGINWLGYGFESANDIKNYGDIWETVEMTREAGINIMGNFMFGLPGDNLDSRTLELAQEINCEYVNFYCAMPYPGSELYTGQNNNWDSYNQYGGVASKAREFRDKAFIQYFSNPKYLKMIRGKFGEQAVTHIESMLGG